MSDTTTTTVRDALVILYVNPNAANQVDPESAEGRPFELAESWIRYRDNARRAGLSKLGDAIFKMRPDIEDILSSELVSAHVSRCTSQTYRASQAVTFLRQHAAEIGLLEASRAGLLRQVDQLEEFTTLVDALRILNR